MSVDYDLITVGGGLAGAALARSIAEAGKRVLVIEGETEFRDRVRGEQMACWGVGESEELGIGELLRSACAQESPWWDIYLGPMLIDHRDLTATTPQSCGNLTFFHPHMQETLLAAAGTAGAEVARGARVRNVEPGATPGVTFERDGREERVTARLVAGCDGRNSGVRRWGGFVAEKDADRCQISGLLIEDVGAPEDTLTVALDPAAGTGTILFPQGGGRARTYFVQRVENGRRFSGDGDVADYMATFESKLPNGEAVMKEARARGPLATFNGADHFVPRPYKDGVALVGDAASSSDPTWGQGLSLTVRDARTLRDELLKNDDWDAAGRAYAAEHDRYYGHVRACEDIFTMIFYEDGADADARRARAIPLIAQDQTRVPDTMQSGPDAVPITAGVRSRFLGEE